MSGSIRNRTLTARIGAAALLLLPVTAVAQHIETNTFNASPVRPKDDPKVVAHGKEVYGAKCASCHAPDLRGALDPDKGPNLLRSQGALVDHGGDVLIPLMMGQDTEWTQHKIDISHDDASDVAAYVRSVLSQIGSQGRPPGEAQRNPSILVGNADHGKSVFSQKCASCHSAEGDLKGLATRLAAPKMLQAAWLRGSYLGHPAQPTTVTVTPTGKPAFTGSLIHIDDFLLTLKMQDGSVKSIRRDGALPKVEVKDPLEAHRKMLPTYTDNEIHDLTAYLVTLK